MGEIKVRRAIGAATAAVLLFCLFVFVSCSDADLAGLVSGLASALEASLSEPDIVESSAPETGGDNDHVHLFTVTEKTEATCTSPGYEISVCSCGEQITETTPALGHSFELSSGSGPTCEDDGFVCYVCSRCKETFSEVTSGSLGHDFILKEIVSPTTSSAGYDLYVCGRCGSEERRNETPALTGASYTDVCSMNSYLVSAMPHETAADVTGKLLQYALATEGKSVSRNGCSPDDVYKGLKEAHNYVMRNVVFGSGEEKSSLYACSDSDVSAMRSDFAWVEASVFSLGIGRTTMVRSAVESINNYLCAKLRYDYEGKNSDAHRAISSGTGICQVYGQLFQLMCQYCGIECYYVEDTAHDHVYNYIVFSDESRLYVDVTWNDSATKTHVEVENAGYTAEQIAGFRSKYLLMTYDEFKTAHGW
ncbi:MAG: hypothetical protein J5919_03415 [Clostridia bacterium]|nr:hypothetical protein [Clostridia bacterium]